jgi:hypothetical protein
MENIVNFFNHPFFSVVGGIATLFSIISIVYIVFLVMKGVLPVWYRLGLGLSKREIAIFAENEYSSLNKMLLDSRIFNSSIQIHKNDIKSAEDKTIFLVHWNDYKDVLSEILTIKKDSTPLIVYAPQNGGRIDDESMNMINSNRNSFVVNFRGRLLNDILTSLITTSYEKR